MPPAACLGWTLENALCLPRDSRGVRVSEETETGAEVNWGTMEKLRGLEETENVGADEEIK